METTQLKVKKDIVDEAIVYARQQGVVYLH